MDLGAVWQAWAGLLAVEPYVFERDGVELVARPDWDSVVVVELGRGCVVAGPPDALDRLGTLDRGVLGDAAALATQLGGVQIGTADLWFRNGAVGQPTPATTSADPADLAVVVAGSAPGEVDESGVAELYGLWVTRTESGDPAAVAGYQPWAGGLAHVGVLTAAAHRGSGFARRAATAAVDAAFEEGLVAQWRCRLGNTASARLAQRLGFEWAGRQTAVRLVREGGAPTVRSSGAVRDPGPSPG